MNVQQSLAKVMESVRSVAKGERNQQQGFVFRGIDAVMNAVGPALREHGVIILPEVLEHNLVGSQTSTGKSINVCRVKVRYTIYGPEGDSITGAAPGESMDSGDKATAKAMSVAYRTFLLQALTLPTDEPDPDTETHEAQHRPVPWDMAQAERAIKFAKGNPDVLRRAWSDAHASGAPSEVLAHITKAAQPTAPLEGEIVE